MRGLILDPGATFGYAFGDFLVAVPPRTGSFKLPDAPLTDHMIALEAKVMDLIVANSITDVYIEQNFIDTTKTGFPTAQKLMGYVLYSGTAARRCRCHCATIELSTWRSKLGLPTQGPKNVLSHPDYARFANKKTKSGGLTEAKRQWVKDRAMDFARKQGCDPKDDNESDAACMYIYKQREILEREASKGRRTDLFEDLPI